MITNRKTLERVELLTADVKDLLLMMGLGGLIQIKTAGQIDVPFFGVRIRFVENRLPDDDRYEILLIPNHDHLDVDDLFMRFAKHGYVRWLREHSASHKLYRFLEYRERWKLILQNNLEKVRGEYLKTTYKSLLDMPYQHVFHEDPTIFDWVS
jgi:hypothetical protein